MDDSDFSNKIIVLHQKETEPSDHQQEELQHYRDLFDLAPNCYLVTDLEGTIQEANRAAAALLGTGQNFLVGKPLISFIADKDHSAFRAKLKGLKQGHRARSCELSLQTGDGPSISACIAASVMKGEDDKSTRLLWQLHDITDKTLAEETLTKTKANELNAVFASMAEPLIIYNNDRVATKANPAATIVFGFNPVGLSQQELLQRLSAKRGNGRLADADSVASTRALRGEPVRGKRYLFRSADGEEKIAASSAAPIRNGNDTIIGAVATWHDITEQETLLEQLETERSKLRAIIENTPSGIVVSDKEGRIALMNAEAERLCAGTIPCGERIESYTRLQPTHPDGTPFDPCDLPLTRSALKGESHSNIEMLVVWPDGEMKNLIWNSVPISDGRGRVTGAIGAFRDITSIKEAEKELQALMEELEGTKADLELRVQERTAELARANEALREEIAQRKMAEERLQLANQHLQDIVEFLPDATFVIDRDNKVIAWNKAMEKMTGVRKEYVMGKGDYAYGVPFYGTRRPILIDLVRVFDPEIESKYQRIERKGDALYAEAYVPSLFGGKGAYVWCTASPLYDGEGNLIGSIESLRDITDRKMAEEELEKKDALLAGVAAAANALLAAQDHSAGINHALEILGRSADVDRVYIFENHESKDGEHFMSQRFEWAKETVKAQIDNPELQNVSYDRMLPRWYTVLESGEPISGSVGNFPESERVIIEPQNTVSLLVVPIMVEGNLWGFIGFDECYVERSWTNSEVSILRAAAGSIGATIVRRQAEEALKESEQRLADIIDFLPDATFVVDREGKVIAWNRAMEAMTGVKAEDLLSKGDYQHAMPFYGERRPILIDLVLKSQEEIERRYENIEMRDGILVGEAYIPDLKGSEAYLWGTAAALYDSKGDIVGAIESVRDITERKRAEVELARKTADLVRSNAELQQFAYVASHDLQEPLRMVASYVQLLERRYKGKLDSNADEFIGYAVDGASRMQQLINDLLTYSRVGTRGKPFEPTDCEVVFDRAVANLKVAIGERDAAVTHDPLPTVLADSSQLVQLMQNLIGNAIKFHGEEPPRVHVSAKREGDGWAFSVCDNGIGIDPQFKERIFLIFQRLHSRAEYPGTGIGLAVCKKIVERHGGRIWVESEPEKGSTFCFTISQNVECPGAVSRVQCPI